MRRGCDRLKRLGTSSEGKIMKYLLLSLQIGNTLAVANSTVGVLGEQL
jgi:hypothetical protein